MEGNIKILNEDCMAVMARYTDNYFDLAVVDPPYGINIAKRTGSIGQKKGQGKITKYVNKNWDANIPNAEYWKELFRVSKNQIVFGGNYFTDFLPPSMGWIVYDKLQPMGVTFAMAELAFTSFNKSVKVFKTKRSNMQNCVSNNHNVGLVNAKQHPAQKPTELYYWIYQNYTDMGDKILDTHLGSGSSAISAELFGVNEFIGCEIDTDYYNDAVKRFNLVTSQTKLF